MKNQGRHGEFEQVVLPHLDAAYNLARWLTRNHDDAQDIVQEASLRALKFFDGFHGEDGRAWLLTIVRNTYYTWRQKNRDRKRDESFDEEFHGLEGDGSTLAGGMPQSNPEQLMMQQASQQVINKALERLPVDSREIIVLRELEDLSYKEIADIVEVPMGTVMSRLARARKLLREQLEQMNVQSKKEPPRPTSKFTCGTDYHPGRGVIVRSLS
jgi:RNA polymerase sigma-70 factor (ECF subfamily)